MHYPAHRLDGLPEVRAAPENRGGATDGAPAGAAAEPEGIAHREVGTDHERAPEPQRTSYPRGRYIHAAERRQHLGEGGEWGAHRRGAVQQSVRQREDGL